MSILLTLIKMDSDNHNQVMLTLGKLDGKLDGVLDRLDISNGRIEKNEDRLSRVEAWQNNIKGRVTIISTGVGILVTFIVLAINKIWK